MRGKSSLNDAIVELTPRPMVTPNVTKMKVNAADKRACDNRRPTQISGFIKKCQRFVFDQRSSFDSHVETPQRKPKNERMAKMTTIGPTSLISWFISILLQFLSAPRARFCWE
jgi:hypothetical protein